MFMISSLRISSNYLIEALFLSTILDHYLAVDLNVEAVCLNEAFVVLS